ncbi:MAG: PEP-CTERM sorting domain-containing protein [Verrucomicrobiales bacterium]|jgi:hypothetical protein|nr:PEP-CTERM sorting domain-containing protein [Verrucomicrobiales bacterium]
MKLKPIKLILTLSVLSAAALNVFADNLYIDGTAYPAESNKSYGDTDTESALNVIGAGGSYSGTNITLSATNNSLETSSFGKGAYINNAILSLTGGNITTSGSRAHGILLYNASSGTLDNVNIVTEELGGRGVYTGSNSTLLLTGGTIHTKGNYGYGIFFTIASSGTLNNVNIKTEGNYGYGVFTENSTSLLIGGTIHTGGIYGYGIFIEGIGSSGTVSNVTIETTGAEGYGVLLNNGSTILLTDSDINATHSASNTLRIINSSTATVNLNHNTLIGKIYANLSSVISLDAANGTVLTGDVIANNNSTVAVTLTDAGTKLTGNFIQDATSEITFTLGDGALFRGAGTLDNLNLQDGAILGFTNTLLVTDTISIGDNITIDFSNLTGTGDYTVLDWSGATGGESISDDQFTIAGDGVEGTFNVDNGKLVFNATAVPEPSTWFLIGLGLGALALIRRRI